mmetsp:Transcript_8199/g.33749  ORF Transcript_8199/g.33749 Transcript_8199/m.33749 type:complete len:240 (+) Transcript_8199:102-821(+)
MSFRDVGAHDGEVGDVLRGAAHPGRRVAVGADLDGGGRVEAAGVVEVGADDEDVLEVVGAEPDVDRLRGEAAVREREERRAAGFEHSRDFARDLERFGQVIDRDAVGDDVERGVLEGERRVGVEVLDDALVDVGVRVELHGVHAERDAAAVPQRVCCRGEVRDVRGAEVEDGGPVPLAEDFVVVCRERGDGGLVDVVHEALEGVEVAIGRLVLSGKIRRRVRPRGGPPRRREDVGDADG